MKLVHLLPVAAILVAIPLVSQSPPQPEDPPSRVARLNWLTGDVSFQPAGVDEWTTASLNYPLSTADHLYTGQDSKLEIHIGQNAIRLAQNTNFGILNLDDSIAQVSLTEGSMEIHLRTLEDDDSFEIATPNGAITLLRTGDYRIDTDPERDATMLTVRAGQAELFSGSNSVIIRAQQTAYFKTDQNPDVQSANDPDDFDNFTAAREGAGTTVTSEPATEGMTGAEDLNAVGTWQHNRGNEDAWVPPVDPGWAPYSDGDWTYEEPWGWTWVDSAPWGFAPFHYGRWAFANGRWVWYPGQRNAHPVYSPALVTFVGGGSAGSVSWFPLGPHDLWIPPWKPAAQGPDLARLSSNRNVPGAIRTMPQLDFVSSLPVGPAVGLASSGEILGSSPLVMPVRQSIVSAPARTRPSPVNRPLIARTAPPPAPVSFAATLGLLAQNRGRPLAPQQTDFLRRQLPAAVMQRAAVRSTVPLIATRPAKSATSTARPGAKPVHQ